MDEKRTTSIEDLLLRRIESQLLQAGASTVKKETLVEILRGVLYEAALTPREETALAATSAPDSGRTDAVDRFLALRVERALEIALAAGAGNAGLKCPPLAPRVVVHRSLPPSERELDLESTTTAALTSRGPLPSPPRISRKTFQIQQAGQEGRGVLVLADGAAIDSYLERHADFKIGDENLGLQFFGGDDDLSLTLGSEDLSAVHVIEIGAAFADLEFTLEQALAARDQPQSPSPIGDATRAAPMSAPAETPTVPMLVHGDDTMVGTLFDGKYLILRRIGKGGFGAVYEARDVRLHHRVAIKMMHPGATRSEVDLEAFVSEARRATRLSHPNIVEWKTFEQSREGTHYFVMELLQGEELEALLHREGTLDARRTARILLQVLDALKTAHQVSEGQSVLHLDLKPKNVFLVKAPSGETEHVKVIDFGIGQFVGGEVEKGSTMGASRTTTASAHDMARTRGHGSRELAEDDDEDPCGPEGTLVSVHSIGDAEVVELGEEAEPASRVVRSTACTPEYAAPEQCAHLLLGEEVVALDGRADLFSLGTIGFQMLVGELPYDKPKRRKDLLRIKQSVDPKKVASMGRRVPRELAQFLDRCLARDREQRFRDSKEAYEALHRFVHPPLRARLIAAAALVAVGSFAAAWMAGPGRAPADLHAFIESGGIERSLDDSKLYLGPARAEAQLRISGLDTSTPIEAVRLVDGRDASANEVPGFHARRLGDQHVVVAADPSAARVQRMAFLEVIQADRGVHWTVPFDLVWLGEGAWALDSVAVEGLGNRVLDPEGASLEIRVRGSSEDLEGVRVEHSGHVLAARRDETRSRSDREVYGLPFESLDLASGPARLDVLVTDLAGRTQRSNLRTDVAVGPLSLTKTSLDATAVAGRYSISPLQDPRLQISTSRRSDVSWTVRDENGSSLMTGGETGVLQGDFPLTGLTRLRGGGSFAGSIDVVADESAYVLHARPGERGIARARLDFTFADSAPEFSVRVGFPDGGRGQELVPGRPLFVSSRDLVVHVDRENELPLRVQVASVRAGDAGESQVLGSSLLVERVQTKAVFPLALAGDGEYTLSVRVWRHDLPGEDSSRDPDAVLEGEVVVDSTPARLSVEDFAAPIVLRSRQDPLPVLLVSAEDEPRPGGRTPTPVEVEWELYAEHARDVPLAGGRLGSLVPGGGPTPCPLPAPWAAAGSAQPLTSDGGYRLILRGVDAAGSAVAPAEVRFQQAVDGPELELARPVPRLRWGRGKSGGFEIEVIARDPNQVNSVVGSVRRAGAAEVTFELEPAEASIRAGASVWRGAVSFDESWSSAAVDVWLAAEDSHGTASEATESRELGTVDRLRPPRVTVEFGGHPVSDLRLVDGNWESSYLFGGRVDAEEEREFSAAGLPRYNSLNTARSWHVAFGPGEIQSFYLDEHEVSVAELLAFVRAQNGYARAESWAAGCAPDEGRRSELAAHLSALDGDLPAVDVTWEEADAYARWVGKRLPSLVEWEYALRGGDRYRPFASARAERRGPSGSAVNYDPEIGGQGAPRPRSADKDATDDTGILDLSGNVSEWTSTPASFLEGAVTPLNLAAHVLEHRDAFLDPRRFERREPADRYWVSGGSFETSRADFSVVDRRRRTWHGPAVGFRCAADADAVAGSARASSEGRPRFHERFEWR